MAARRGWGSDGIYFDHAGPCTDPARHRHCPGRWRGVISLGAGPDGKRIRRKVSGQTKAIVADRLAQLHRDLDAGARPAPANHTLRQAAEDWLAHGLPGRSAKTIRKNKDVLEPILAAVGTMRLKELTSADVETALAHMADSYSTAAVSMGHLALKRVIRRAQARRYVTINAAEFADTPAGQPGRPSKSLTLQQSAALLNASDGTRIGAYIALSLGTGIRTEEARALLWEHVDLGDPHATPPRPASIAVWRSVRAHGDTKTPSSRRTLGLPAIAVDALAQLQQHEGRVTGPVFATRDGGELDAANVRREFRAAVKSAGIDGTWTPRELRHTFVSLLSDSGVPVEEIARLAGHATSRTTEIVYRHQLRPVMEKGAQAMDQLFRRTAWHHQMQAQPPVRVGLSRRSPLPLCEQSQADHLGDASFSVKMNC
jgi:integrase